MRFALLGNHPDGLALAGALAASGRHQLIAYSGPADGAELLRRRGATVTPIGDIEEVLADPAVEVVIVAGKPGTRPEQLRRALQSERHVLCVYPPDQGTDIAYEAAMIQGDTHMQLLPLMSEALHPAIARLAELARTSDGPVGALRLIEMERWAQTETWTEPGSAEHKPSLPGWDVLRALAGEISEVSAFAAGEELVPSAPVLLAGQFERGGLFQAALVPGQYETRWRLAVVGSVGRAELVFPEGCPGPARLSWRDRNGPLHEETWDAWDPWPAFIALFESVVRGPAPGAERRLSWQDAIRCLELDDAARRSVHRRRASSLEYPEASEETGFKGTMTLVGCGLLWGVLLLLILSAWMPLVPAWVPLLGGRPWLGWAILPVLVVFLLLQLLRWVVPGKKP